MIKQGLKNYLKNLKYVFTPLGALALGVVFGLSIGLPIIVKALSDLLNMVVQISQNTQIRLEDLITGILDRVDSLDWDNPLRALDILLDRAWLTETISGCIESISVDMSQLESYINGCISDIESAFRIFVFFIILGFVGGYFITKWLIRREIAKRALWKYFLISFVDSLLTATLVAFCLWILTLWSPSIFISTLVSLMLFGSIQLFEAYVVHAWKKVDYKKIINVKNVAKLYASDILIFAIAVVLVGIVIAITNVLVGLFVGIAVIEIAFIVIGLNAEAYVKNVAGVLEDEVISNSEE